MSKIQFTIILDLDHTLLHTQDDNKDFEKTIREAREGDPEFRRRVYTLPFDGDGFAMWGVLRPRAIDFYEYCFSRFEKVVVWSAGEPGYVHAVVKMLKNKTGLQPHAVFTSDDIEMREGNVVKPLSKIFERIGGLTGSKNAIIVDDTESTFSDNPHNAVHIPRFYISEEDLHLSSLHSWIEDCVVSGKCLVKTDKSSIFSATA